MAYYGGGGYGSNYPQQGYGMNPYAQGAMAAGGYPPSSGPPPAPGYGGYGGNPYGGGYQQPSAYGGGMYQQSAAQNMSTGQYPVGQVPMGQMPMGQMPGQAPMGQQPPYNGAYAGAAVPGFTAPPQNLAMPQSRGYAQANAMFQPVGCQMQNLMSMVAQQNQGDPKHQEYLEWKQQQEEKQERRARRNRRRKGKGRKRRGKGRRRRDDDDYDSEDDDEDDDDDDDEEDEEEVAKLKEMLEYEKKKTQEALDNMQSNEDQKAAMRQSFVAELLRRQTVSGTFEDAIGTVMAFKKYDAPDPVNKWFVKNKGHDIVGEAWDPLYDSEYLYKAMDGCGTNEDAIIYVTSSRCNAQRQKIRLEFKTAYGKDLIKELKSELSGDFKQSILACYETPPRYDAWEVKNAIYDLIKELKSELSGDFKEMVLACYESPARFDAWSIKKAIYGLGTDEKSLIEIMLTRTNDQIKEMRAEYNKITYAKQKDPESSIEKDIEGDTSGDFKRLLISSTTGNRRLVDPAKLEAAVEEVEYDGKFTGMFKINYDKLADPKKCQRMAQELFDAGEDKWGTDEATFNRIFSTQDFYTLRSVYDKYVKISQRDILNSVDRETSGDFKRGLCAVAQSVKCRPKFFAQALHKSMKGLGTDDSTLIRICITRSEIDMVQIKACFLEEYKQTLWNFINDDCSGDYRKLLQAIVGRD